MDGLEAAHFVDTLDRSIDVVRINFDAVPAPTGLFGCNKCRADARERIEDNVSTSGQSRSRPRSAGSA